MKRQSPPLAALAALLLLPVAACDQQSGQTKDPGVAQASERSPTVSERSAPVVGDPADWDNVLTPYDKIEADAAETTATIDWDAVMVECGADPGADAVDITERGVFKVLGCKLSLNFKSVKKCINKKINSVKKAADRKVKEAKAAARKSFDRELKNARKAAERKLASLKSGLKREIDKAVRAQVKNVQSKLAKATKQAAAELKKSKGLQRMVSDLTNQLKKGAGGLKLNLSWHRDLFQGVQGLPLAGMFQCLGKEARAGRFDFVKDSRAFTQNPVGFVHTKMSKLVRQIGPKMSAFITDELGRIARGGRIGNEKQMVRRAFDVLGECAGSIGGGRCVFNEVRPLVEPSAVKLVKQTQTMVVKMQREARRILEKKILPVLQKKISEALKGVMAEQCAKLGVDCGFKVPKGNLPPQIEKLLLTEKELKAVVREVLYKRSIKKRFQIAKVNMQKLMNPATAKNAALGHIKDLRKLTQGTKDYEALYLEIGVEVLREMGHKYINSAETGHGGYLLNVGVGLLQVSEGTIEKVASALCGLIPEAGAAICNVVEWVLNNGWNQGCVPALESLAKTGMEKSVDMVADQLLDQVHNPKNMKKLRRAQGPVGVFLAALPHEQALGILCGAILKDEMKMLDEHFDKVADMAASKYAN